jgi:hypothetical protein
MEWLVPAIVAAVVIVFAIVGQKRGWIDLSNAGAKRRGGGGAPLGAIDEIFQPTRYEAQLQQDRETVLPAPSPVPGDGDKDVYKGNVKIRVPGQ